MMYIPKEWYVDEKNAQEVRKIFGKYFIDTDMQTEKAREELLELGETKIVEKIDDFTLKLPV